MNLSDKKQDQSLVVLKSLILPLVASFFLCIFIDYFIDFLSKTIVKVFF